jgi:hypothetical protein
MEPAKTNSYTTLQLTESFGDYIDIPSSRIVVAQAEGRLPHVTKTPLGRTPENADLAELGFQEACSTTTIKESGTTKSALFTTVNEDTLLHVSSGDADGSAWVMIGGSSEDRVAELVRTLRERFFEEKVEVDPKLVPVRFSWYSTSARFRRRLIESPKWEEVSGNYPGTTKTALEQLHTYQPEMENNGRLLMFHGEPGTGKTTAVRSLARSWSAWCTTTYIVDPESLFMVPDYLLEVALEGDSSRRLPKSFSVEDFEDGFEDETGAKWQLIVVEDVDELIRADAKNRTGQALGRLLNLTDGLLGQGLRTMFLLTTNERMESVHPAVSRPGRCLANIEFATFTKTAGEAWLRNRGSKATIRDEHVSLAELFALSGSGVISAAQESRGHGVYL